MNDEINKMAVWFRANKMAVNVQKTKFIVFHTRGKQVNEEDCVLTYNANEPDQPADQDLIYTLERYHDKHVNKNCRSYKLLGVYLDEFMSFNQHTNHICNKLSKALYCINRAKSFINIKSLKTLYYALIHSNLNYCPLIFNSTSQKNIAKISTIQRKAIRVVTKSKYRAHTDPLFKEHGILPFEKIIYLSASLFMHSIEYGYAPIAFIDVWTKNNNRDLIYGLRNNNDYVIPHPELKFSKNLHFTTCLLSGIT